MLDDDGLLELRVKSVELAIYIMLSHWEGDEAASLAHWFRALGERCGSEAFQEFDAMAERGDHADRH